VPVANRVMPDYELVIATQDWHPTGYESFGVDLKEGDCQRAIEEMQAAGIVVI